MSTGLKIIPVTLTAGNRVKRPGLWLTILNIFLARIIWLLLMSPI